MGDWEGVGRRGLWRGGRERRGGGGFLGSGMGRPGRLEQLGGWEEQCWGGGRGGGVEGDGVGGAGRGLGGKKWGWEGKQGDGLRSKEPGESGASLVPGQR